MHNGHVISVTSSQRSLSGPFNKELAQRVGILGDHSSELFFSVGCNLDFPHALRALTEAPRHPDSDWKYIFMDCSVVRLECLIAALSPIRSMRVRNNNQPVIV